MEPIFIDSIYLPLVICSALYLMWLMSILWFIAWVLLSVESSWDE